MKTIKLELYTFSELTNNARYRALKEHEDMYWDLPIVPELGACLFTKEGFLQGLAKDLEHLEVAPSDFHPFPLLEAIADIALYIGASGFVPENSRDLIDNIVSWAKEFETVNAGVQWGIDGDLDYIEAIDQFAFDKLTDAVNSGHGLWDKHKAGDRYLVACEAKNGEQYFTTFPAGNLKSAQNYYNKVSEIKETKEVVLANISNQLNKG